MNADEHLDLRKLLELLERAKRWEELTGNPSDTWQAQAGSALAGDDAKTDPYQLSHAAWHALTVAVDHLHYLRGSEHSEQSRSTIAVTPALEVDLMEAVRATLVDYLILSR